MPNDLGATVLTVLDRIVDRVLGSRPVRTDGKPLNDVVYSHLHQGTLVDPRDFARPWSPAGGATLQDAPPAGAPGAPPADVALKRAMYTAWRTAELANGMLMVTNDGTYEPYRTGRHVDFSYGTIVESMRPVPSPPMDPAVQKRIDEARKVLNDMDADGNIVGRSKLYQRYLDNAAKHAKAKTAFALGRAEALQDPTKAELWPQIAGDLQQQVDQAWDDWKTQGAEKVEAALATIESVGGPVTEKMIAKALKILDAWNLQLAGVPVKTGYCYIDPSSWADLAVDDIGWERLTVTSSEGHSHTEQNANSFASSYWRTHSSSTGASGGATYGFIFGAAGHGSSASTESRWGSSASSDSTYTFHNDGKNFSVDLEWGLCTINRPWLVSDLFYMQGWYLPGQKKNSISDGTIGNQVLKEEPLLPMIPQQFVVVRNVKIKSADWGSDGQTLKTLQQQTSGKYDAKSSSYGGSAGVSVGFFSIGGSVSHSDSSASSDWAAEAHSHEENDWGWHFDGQTLEIRGAQIVGWISEIVPPTPPLDDPGLQ
jgi:hypothetical protein